MEALPVEKKVPLKIHRIGSITFGSTLIISGLLFLSHIIYPVLSLDIIFCFWPCIFIMLGIEILVANHKGGEQFVYDKTAIFLTVILTMFAMVMGFLQWGMEVAINNQQLVW